MRTLVHLSDLHFGAVDNALLEPLANCVHGLRPDLVVVSGDLTQRARPIQFQEARRFLDTLPKPQLVVPGNHDVPLYNVFQRFFQPLDKFRRYITADLDPEYSDDEITVVGINTARSLTFKRGRINEEQIEYLRGRLCKLDDRITKIVVTHHPFDLPPGADTKEIVGRARAAMGTLADCGVDLLLAGHLHTSAATDTSDRYDMGGYAALVVQAGTATSTRERGEENSFNVIRVAPVEVCIDRYMWNPNAREFLLAGREAYDRAATGWRKKLPDKTSRNDARDESAGQSH